MLALRWYMCQLCCQRGGQKNASTGVWVLQKMRNHFKCSVTIFIRYLDTFGSTSPRASFAM